MKKIVLTVVATAFLIIAARGAHADTEEANCSVSNVTWNAGSTGKFLYVICANNATHFGFISTPPTGCAADDIDTLKMWQSTAASAKLSGKTVSVWYKLCGPTNNYRSITAIELKGL